MTTAADISVVICTYNRGAMLWDTLESWSTVDRDQINVQLVVIDNACTDDTASEVKRFQEQFDGWVDYVYEGNPGLSNARNRGFEEAKGDIVAFVDDDIYFHTDWLQAVMAAFRSHPEFDAMGGKSIPVFEVDKPEWLTQDMNVYYGSTMSGDETREMSYPEHPFGVNMAFRRHVFETVGGFRADLGRVGTSLLSNEEKEYFYRVAQADFRVLYVSDAVLDHRVPEERLQKEWLKSRAYWQGISNVVFDRHVGEQSWGSILKACVQAGKRMLIGSGNHSPGSMYRYITTEDLPTLLQRRYNSGIFKQSARQLFSSGG